MSTLRYNGIWCGGTIASPTNPITLSSATATTCSWSTAPLFPSAISLPDLAKIILEPDTANEEIIALVGWVPGTTSGQVIRMYEISEGGTQVPIIHSAVGWVHGPTAREFHVLRPSAVIAKMAFR